MNVPTPLGQPVATYDYVTGCGRLLYQVVRLEPKDFRIRRPNPDRAGELLWGLAPGIERIPYRLGDLNARRDAVVFVVEGEKDVDLLRDNGLVATTMAGGASAQWTASAAEYLRDRNVIVIPDNDPVGRQFMERTVAALQPVARNLSWLDLPGVPLKGDVSDWFAMNGAHKEEFLRMVLAHARPIDPPRPTPPNPEEMARRDLVRFEDLDVAAIRWLWRPWLPLGKLCLIDGDPGQGKSFVTLDLAARLSRGDEFPDGQPGPGEPMTTLLVSCEDGLDDTVLPRLIALGADMRYIRGYQGERKDGRPFRLPALPEDLPLIEAAVRESGAKLVVIDPLMAFLSGSVNSISDQSVRSVLSPLATLAERLNVCIVFVRHLNKTNGKQAVYRGGGSIGIVAAMRTAMLIARHPHDRDQRVLAMVKCNLGPEPESLAFRLTASRIVPEGTNVEWLGKVDLLANDLVGDVKEVIDPRDWLREALSGGPRRMTELVEEAKSEGLSQRTLERAKVRLGILSKKHPGHEDRGWYWLPVGATDFPRRPILEPLEELADLD